MLGALPLGALTDRIVEGAHPVRRIKTVVLAGWLGLACSYALLGPLSSVSPTGALHRGGGGSNRRGVCTLLPVSLLIHR